MCDGGDLLNMWEARVKLCLMKSSKWKENTIYGSNMLLAISIEQR